MSVLNKSKTEHKAVIVDVTDDSNVKFSCNHIEHYRVTIHHKEYISLLKAEYLSPKNWLIQFFYLFKAVCLIIYLGIKIGIAWSIGIIFFTLMFSDSQALPDRPISFQDIAELLQNSVTLNDFISITITVIMLTTFYYAVFSRFNIIDIPNIFKDKALEKIYARLQEEFSSQSKI
ncbi:hypothetical protein Q7Z28_03065 [Glaesserella parasuis]|uniref:hypothetical protein n=1 Tax=Glaesserella parasuis TaxID=738 RepID=UPI0003AC3AAF|nr:hypothetical protein [Glaesserella parasuis]ATW43733.1 hypothetical protein A2U20_08030 [Glaesserella parasuis D74]EQA10106.1 hypothetical protein HPSD74_0942 [Glaesserella parasuis D74]MDP0317165.1 hypothetical protein [Glaesserella parasuis]